MKYIADVDSKSIFALTQAECVPMAPSRDTVSMVTTILSAFLRTNPCSVEELPRLFVKLCAVAGQNLEAEALTTGRAMGPRQRLPHRAVRPAVPVTESIYPDHLVCLEDGKKVKTLKAYLWRVYGLTPDDYRARWGLADDYPMVCPDLRAVRQRVAIKNKIHLKRKFLKSKAVLA